jgi:hypothetical protein
MLLFTACRRDLWVYTDQYHQVELFTDWSEATEKPDGMTWWFMKDDHSGDYHGTTAEVTHTWLGLPNGTYSGVVFDYSPAEYSHQEFIGMDHIDNALVHILPSADQPEPDEELYGATAVKNFAEAIPIYSDGMYQVAAEPEIMNADTLHHVNVVSGFSDDRILWDEADKYTKADSTEVQTLYAWPKPIVWKLNIRVYVRNIIYMNSVTASVAGLTDGCWLGPLRHTSTPCLQRLDDWTRRRIEDVDSVGILSTYINTFGLQDVDMPPSPYDARQASRTATVDYDEHLQLNLRFLLRDKETVLYYHFNVDSRWITIDDGKLVIDLEIPIDVAPDLPYVEEAEVAGFDATVTPWEDGGTADTTM